MHDVIDFAEVKKNKESAQYWAGLIQKDWNKSREGIIDAGKHLIEAEDSVDHGEWGILTGRGQPDNKGILPFSYSTAFKLMAIAKDERLSNVSHVQHLPTSWGTLYEISKLDEETFSRGVEKGIIRPDMERKDLLLLTGGAPHVSHNSGQNEWYTPKEYIEAARRVMGGIDLDPASSEKANETVRADRIYTSANNGLNKDWYGRVWMNPPYSSDLIGEFCGKLVRHVDNKDVSQAIVLVNNATETQWFCEMISVATSVCFPLSRVRFWGPDGTIGAPLQGQAIIGISCDKKAFVSAFASIGWCAHVSLLGKSR